MVYLGSIDFINSMPVDYAITSGLLSTPCIPVRGVPTHLNSMIDNHTLDISPVSSLHYANHASELLLLPDLSISSRSGAKSVLLFSQMPVDQLEGKKIAVTSEGKTTPTLLKIILYKRYGIRACLGECRAMVDPLNSKEWDASLVIGDEALAASLKVNPALYVTDLAQEWYDWTGYPFVFALWVVRKEFLKKEPKLTQEVFSRLHESKKWGQDHESVLVEAAGKKTNLPIDLLRSYFQGLRFDFDADLRKGFAYYIELAKEMGLAEEGACFNNCEEEFLNVSVTS